MTDNIRRKSVSLISVHSEIMNYLELTCQYPLMSVVFVALVGAFLFNSVNLNEDAQKPLLVEHKTRIGEFRTVTLSDFSRVTLNTNSRISVAYNEQSEIRRIHLLQGEAFFDVAKDPLRPFVVNVNGKEIRVVGTAFNVKSNSGYLEVLVKEGIVDFVDLSKSAEKNRRQTD